MIAMLLVGILATWLQGWAPLHEADRNSVDSLLADERWAALDDSEKLHALAALRLGTPYLLGCLGEEEEPDPDPFFRLDRTDCTVLVITNAALLGAGSWDDAESLMVDLHYRSRPPGYENRFHFTSDRILHSPFFEDLTGRVAPDSALRSMRAHLNRTAEGEPLLPISWNTPLAVRYLPTSRLGPEILSRLPSACGVAFLREKNPARGYLVSHEGILLDGHRLHHASSAEGRVVEVPLLEYLSPGDSPLFDGVLFYRIVSCRRTDTHNQD